MTQVTHALSDSPDYDKSLEVPEQYSMTRVLGYLAVIVGLASICSLPFAYLSISHGFWRGGSLGDFPPTLVGLYVTAALGVSFIGTTAGIASSAGKPWSRMGMILYADLSIVLAIVGVLPFYLFVIRQPSMDWGLRHAVELLVVLKAWLIELPLAIVILYRFTRPALMAAYQHPVVEAPDRSKR